LRNESCLAHSTARPSRKQQRSLQFGPFAPNVGKEQNAGEHSAIKLSALAIVSSKGRSAISPCAIIYSRLSNSCGLPRAFATAWAVVNVKKAGV
jgi:hypothetical protein